MFVAACASDAPTATSPSFDRTSDVSAVSSRSRSTSSQRSVFNTQLRADNEVAPATQTSLARGNAQVKVNDDGTVSFKLVVHNAGDEEFFLGHIHEGVAGANGPVVIDFDVPAKFPFVAERSQGQIVLHGEVTARPLVVARLLQNPEGFYVNLHT